MIFAIQAVIFLFALRAKQKYITLILAIASLIIPDEIPMVDEIVMLAINVRNFYLDYNNRTHRKGIQEGKSEDDVGT